MRYTQDYARGKPLFFRTKNSKDKRKGDRCAIILTLKSKGPISLPCKIHLTRIAPRSLDGDNLPNAFKSITDDIADFLIPGLPRGHADGDSRLEWQYSQEKGHPKEYALRIEITHG
jgi:hypothetical protein